MKRDSVTRELAAILLLVLTLMGAHRYLTQRAERFYEEETYSVQLAPTRRAESFFSIR